jgi:hypothetical protein
MPGQGRLANCLMQNLEKLSNDCQMEIRKNNKEPPRAIMATEKEIKK